MKNRAKRVLPKRSRRNRYILVAVIFVGLFLFLTKSLFVSRWDGQRRITVVVQNLPRDFSQQGDNLAIFSIEPRGGKAVYILFPPELLLNVPYGYKTYTAGSVYRLGELDKSRGGGTLLAKSIEATFGLATEGYFVENESSSSHFVVNSESDFKKIKKSDFSFSGIIFSLPSFLSHIKQTKTNFSPLDSFRLWNTIRILREDQIEYIDLSKSQALKKDFLPDGTRVENLDKDLFDLKLPDTFEDSQVRSSSETLEIVNATSTEKIASQFSNILEAMGANIISKSTAKSQEKEGCSLFLSDSQLIKQTIVDRLSLLYGCKIIKDKKGSGQADITIILGEEFIK